MTGPDPMRFSPDDVAAARKTLEQARAGEAVPIVILTDEEVVILDGLEHDQLVPTPWLEAQEGADRSLVGRVALRSLLAREMVLPASVTDGSVRITAHPGITGPLVLRRTAQEILSAERTTSGGKHWAFAYVHDEDGSKVVLEEEISDSGHHAFSVYPFDHLGERWEAFLDPTGVAVMGGKATTIPADALPTQAPELPQLKDAVAVSVVSAVRKGQDFLVNASVYAGPHGVHVLRGEGRDAAGGPASYVLQEVGPRGLRALPEELVSS
ncbi:hypothetical protein [Isoptericola croceus]|uniref:hypothetical protein n=1 Tax=Isoptericola croceus TaxID=3031406 RepID=UPI0023F819C7|nr:hypothetical protein [Isoptericola croceus]